MALRMDPERRRKLEALSRLHDEWSERHGATAAFRPDEHPDSDYNLHHVDVDPAPDAEREFLRRAREIMGLDPDSGLRTSG